MKRLSRRHMYILRDETSPLQLRVRANVISTKLVGQVQWVKYVVYWFSRDGHFISSRTATDPRGQFDLAYVKSNMTIDAFKIMHIL